MAEVRLENVSKRFGGVVALDAVDLHAPDRELLALLGPSGCGKTTALRLIAGLEEPSSGAVRIGGRKVNDVRPKDRNVAMVFQDHAIYPHWTVRRNLEFGLKLRKVPRAARAERIRRAAKLLEIEELLGRKPAELSGGQRQRVALGRAIVRKPDVFLLDEPLAHLDARLRDLLCRQLAQLRRRLDTTTIYVTHDCVEAMMLGDRIAVMRRGRIEQTGAPAEIYERPASRFVAELIGRPPMNFLDVRLVEREGTLYVELCGELLTAPGWQRRDRRSHWGETLWLGVRPEDIALTPASLSPRRRASLSATVAAVRPLGPEILVELERESLAFIARVPRAAAPSLHQNVTVYLDLDRVRLFECNTGLALTPAAPQ